MAGVKAQLLAVAIAVSYLLHTITPQYQIQSSLWKTGLVVYAALIFGLATWRLWLYPNFFSPLRSLPMPRNPYPFIGQLLRIIKEPTGMPHREWIATIPNDGLIKYRFLFNAERVIPVSSKALAEVLVTKSYDFIKPPMFTANLGRILGPLGILFAEGDVHRQERKLLSPAFNFRHIKELYPLFWGKSAEMVRKVYSEYAKTRRDPQETEMELEIGSWASRATLDIIGAGALSRSFNAIENPESDLNVIYRRAFQPSRAEFMAAILTFWVPTWIMKRIPTSRNKRIDEAAQALRTRCRQFIHDKKAELKLAVQDEKAEPNEKAGNNKDILSLALQSNAFSEASLIDQLMTFLAAGHETTATAMMWSVWTMCEHPEIQDKLRKALQAANLPSPLAEDAAPMTSSQIDSIPYLAAFCSELLRHQPPVPFTSRMTSKDTTITGQVIPKGTNVILLPFAINRSTQSWGPDADVFNPERWLTTAEDGSVSFNGNGGAESNFGLMTFLHGPRSCIGEKFARAEFMCLIATWVLAFQSEATWKTGTPDTELKIETAVTRKIAGGVKVRVTPLLSN